MSRPKRWHRSLAAVGPAPLTKPHQLADVNKWLSSGMFATVICRRQIRRGLNRRGLIRSRYRSVIATTTCVRQAASAAAGGLLGYSGRLGMTAAPHQREMNPSSTTGTLGH